MRIAWGQPCRDKGIVNAMLIVHKPHLRTCKIKLTGSEGAGATQAASWWLLGAHVQRLSRPHRVLCGRLARNPQCHSHGCPGKFVGTSTSIRLSGSAWPFVRSMRQARR